MEKLEFDATKLKQLCEIDVESALRNFDNPGDYFQCLEDFIEDSAHFLRSYDTMQIVRNDDERHAFTNEIKSVKQELLSLGMTYPVETLTELNFDAQKNDSRAIEARLNKFHGEMSRLSKCVALSVAKDAADALGPQGTIQTEQLSPMEQLSQPTARPSRTEPQKEKPLILAVDDKPELLTYIVNLLEDRFKVMAATSGKAALKVIQRHPPVLFLLDIEMPEMNGFQLTEEIRTIKQFAETPIIFLTSKNKRDYVVSAIKRGGNDYVVKPVEKDLLLSKIYKHLGEI